MPLSAESKGERLRARIEKFDLEGPILDRIVLADQLIQPVFRNLPVSMLVGIDSVIGSRVMTVDLHAKPNWFSIRGRTQDQVHISRMEAKDDFTGR